jgi:Ala-tRNA(Pro) deacylase
MGVAEFLTEHHVEFETLVHPPAFTAQKRAKILGVPGKHVAKAVLLVGPRGYFLAILPATMHVDTAAVAGALGGPVRLANEREVLGVFRDCEWGVVEPFGTLYSLPTILDESLSADDWIIFEGNTHFEAVRMRCRDYEHLEQPQRLSFARP